MYVLANTNTNQKARKEMEHFTLKNGTTIRSEKQAAAEFLKVHADQAKLKADLDTLKDTIKANDAFAWFRHGIKVSVKPTSSFDKEKAITLLKKLGVTDRKIANLTRYGQTKRVELAKK